MPFYSRISSKKAVISVFVVVGLIRPEICPESTVSVADALFPRPLIGSNLGPKDILGNNKNLGIRLTLPNVIRLTLPLPWHDLSLAGI